MRAAVENLVMAGGNSLRNRYMITTRPSAANIADQLAVFRRVDVQPLTPEKCQGLVNLWCEAVYPTMDIADQKASDLVRRLNDERVRSLAGTPLMVNIFALVYYNKRDLPSQRAELYEYAVLALLSDPHHQGHAVDDQETWAGSTSAAARRAGVDCILNARQGRQQYSGRNSDCRG